MRVSHCQLLYVKNSSCYSEPRFILRYETFDYLTQVYIGRVSRIPEATASKNVMRINVYFCLIAKVSDSGKKIPS